METFQIYFPSSAIYKAVGTKRSDAQLVLHISNGGNSRCRHQHFGLKIALTVTSIQVRQL